MVFDADVHVSTTEINGLKAEEVLCEMDKARVDMANIWLMPPYLREIEDANRYVYKSAKAYPDRFVATGWLDPHFGQERSMAMLRQCVEVYGMKAVKMNGAQNNFYIDDESLFPYFDYLQTHQCMLALHIGSDFYDFTHPTRAEKIAKAFPNLHILMVHMGGAGVPDLGKACIEVAKRCNNMTLVGSAISYLRVVEAIRTLGPQRVCFGSDTPFAMMNVERVAYEAFLPDVADDKGKALVMGGNAMKLWNVKAN